MRYTAMGVAVIVAACPGALGGSAGPDDTAPGASDGGARPPRTDFVLHDNGEPDGSGGYSNATVNVFGFRRTLLDDFIVTPNHPWVLEGLEHWAIWNTFPPGSGVGMDIAIREDADGTPGSILYQEFTEDYFEQATGRTRFSRPEYLAWTGFGPLALPPGRYWIEATVVGPENNFWLAHWGPCVLCDEDFNSDGTVDVEDLLVILAYWGPCV